LSVLPNGVSMASKATVPVTNKLIIRCKNGLISLIKKTEYPIKNNDLG
jgi:hypothetical protein